MKALIEHNQDGKHEHAVKINHVGYPAITILAMKCLSKLERVKSSKDKHLGWLRHVRQISKEKYINEVRLEKN